MDSYSEVLATEGGGFRVFFDPHKDADPRDAERQIENAILQQQENDRCSSS